PYAYADFEGTIPEGQYGAGQVTIWDRGTYENLRSEELTAAKGIAAGRLGFSFHGKKLPGGFCLIRIRGRGGGKDNWLLIKMKDELAHSKPDADGLFHQKAAAKRRPKATPTRPRDRPAAKLSRKEVVFTNQDKLMYPEEGITKGEVIEFYRRV